MKVVDIEDYKPHMAIAMDGNAHVLPVSVIRDVSNGKLTADNAVTRLIAIALMDRINEQV